jgi:hypothetical protein
MAITTSGTTLTFNDATTQTTAPVNTNANVTSATAVAGTGISITAVTTTGAATHTVTNSGVTSIVAGSGISISGATGAVTVTASGGGVTSLNGQTGAITNSDRNSIGSYVACFRGGATTGTTYNSTYAASTLYILTSSTSGGAFGQFLTNGSSNSNISNGTLSGTWRAMTSAQNGTANCCGYYNLYTALFVRIS